MKPVRVDDTEERLQELFDDLFQKSDTGKLTTSMLVTDVGDGPNVSPTVIKLVDPSCKIFMAQGLLISYRR